jgi:hypothetical protein
VNTATASTSTRSSIPPAPIADPAARPDGPVYALDGLAAMTVAELTAVYRRGRVPASLAALDGAPPCRMLTAVGPLGRPPIAGVVRQLARSNQFPWAGKAFEAADSERGTGINRIRLAGGRSWFPFDTRIEASAIDGDPCIFLDYRLPENPWVIRHIRDELREVSPGMFLGPAMWQGRDRARLILYFAVDQTNGASPGVA